MERQHKYGEIEYGLIPKVRNIAYEKQMSVKII